MNTALTVWSIFAGNRPNRCGFNEELAHWCSTQKHIALRVCSCDEMVSGKSANGEHPDVILLNSTRRGEFSPKFLQRVVGKYPLAQVLEITGEWCIGDTRSGDPLPIACRFDTTVARQRLTSMLVSRQHFLQTRAELNPLSSFSELSEFWNQSRFAPRRGGLYLISSNRSERRGLQRLLMQEGFKIQVLPKVRAISEDDRYWSTVLCISDRNELREFLRQRFSSPIVVITSHFNELDRSFFDGADCVTFLRKPFLALDLINAISNVVSLANANAA